MSVINTMLQELDRRNASAGPDAEPPPAQVKAVSPSPTRHEWFWRIVAALMLAAVAWVGWVAFQLRPRPAVATELAFKAAEQARKGPITASSPPVVAQPPAVAPVVAPPAPALREPPETLRLAQAIETPITERPAAEPSKVEPPKPEAKKPEEKTAPAPKPSVKTVVNKRDRSRSSAEIAEASFRRAAAFLNLGRVSEAEDQLIGALHADASHVGARQAYVSLLLEQKRTDAAKRVLKEALDANPGQPVFSLALARILAEQRDYRGALDVMDRAGPVAQNADFQAVRGAVMQRLGRHQEAVDAYHAAVQGAVQPGTTWVGLGISLEALGRRAEAAEAYRRSLGGPLASEVRDYAEARVRALQ